MTLVDSHAHLNFPELLVDIDEVLARAKEAGVEKIINIGTNLEDSKIAVELAQKYDNLYATVGVHPEGVETDWVAFENLAKQPKVVAIGECGFDLFKIQDPGSKTQEITRQKEIFTKQVEFAGKLNLPLVIHIREAQEDLMAMTPKVAGVLHCFSGDRKYLDWVLEQTNFYISFAGNVTFKNAESLRDLARLVPLDRILVETDCPFLAPEPLRGSQNEPANVKITAQMLAKLHSIGLDKLSKITSANAVKLFNF